MKGVVLLEDVNPNVLDGNIWEGGKKRRKYIDIEELLDIKVSKYGTGNIRDVSYAGEPKSNSWYRKNVMYAKLYIDLNTHDLVADDLGEDLEEDVVDKYHYCAVDLTYTFVVGDGDGDIEEFDIDQYGVARETYRRLRGISNEAYIAIRQYGNFYDTEDAFKEYGGEEEDIPMSDLMKSDPNLPDSLKEDARKIEFLSREVVLTNAEKVVVQQLPLRFDQLELFDSEDNKAQFLSQKVKYKKSKNFDNTGEWITTIEGEEYEIYKNMNTGWWNATSKTAKKLGLDNKSQTWDLYYRGSVRMGFTKKEATAKLLELIWEKDQK